jgi:hypothetical protein
MSFRPQREILYFKHVTSETFLPGPLRSELRVEDRPSSYIALVIILISRQGGRSAPNDKLLGLFTTPSSFVRAVKGITPND